LINWLDTLNLKTLKNRKVILLLVIHVFLIALFLVLIPIKIKQATFPFVELEIVSADQFNAPPEDQSLDYSTIPLVLPDELENKSVAYALRHELAHGNEMVFTSPEQAVSEDEIRVLCSEYSKAAVSVFEARGSTARVVWLSEHTVTELWDEELQKWVLYDTNGNQMYFSEDGEPLGVAELMTDIAAEPEPIVMEESQNFKDDPQFNETSRRLYQETDVCVVLTGNRLYDFHLRNKDPKIILSFLIGGDPVANGIQIIPPGKEQIAGSIRFQIRFYFWIIVVLFLLGLTSLAKAIRDAEEHQAEALPHE